MTHFNYMEPPQFVLCLCNKHNPASLIRGKVYRVVVPYANDPASYVRVVDESADDYIFPRDWFEPVELSGTATSALAVEDQAIQA